MELETTDMAKIHHGNNIQRLTGFRRMPQKELAAKLKDLTGDEWTQRKVSWLFSKENVERDLLEKVAKALGADVEYILNMTNEAAINYFNHFSDHASNNGSFVNGNNNNYDCTFNPLDKYAESIEENKKLYAELIKEKQEKIELLERLLKEK